jgi:hypothetical protein
MHRVLLAVLFTVGFLGVSSVGGSAQELLSGDSVVPWGCGPSPNGAYYQPCAASAGPSYSTYSTWSYPTYSAPSYTPSYTASTYNPYADTSRIRIDVLPTTQAGWCARSYARGDSVGATVWGC